MPPVASPRLPKVLVLPPTCFARERVVGGGERYALEYARALADIVPTTLALFDTIERPVSELDGKLEIRTFPVASTRANYVVRPAGGTWRDLGGYDLMHLMWFPTPIADLLMLSAILREQPVVLTDVGGGAPCLSSRLGVRFLRCGLYRWARGIANLSAYAATLMPDYRQPSTVLLGGADQALRDAGEGTFDGYALFVGRLLKHKGVLELVEAVSPGTPLRVVGRPYDPAYFEKLKQAAAGKQVTFITDADDAELRRQYAGANVVLQPSIPEGDRPELLGLVCLEGMASGKPVIVTRLTSLPELVRDGETGFIVEPLNRAELGRRIDELVLQPELARRLGAQARAHARAHFTWAATARRGLDLYRRVGGQELADRWPE
jgi:glycosyltransferase involved in cell wall biosynthesis